MAFAERAAPWLGSHLAVLLGLFVATVLWSFGSQGRRKGPIWALREYASAPPDARPRMLS